MGLGEVVADIADGADLGLGRAEGQGGKDLVPGCAGRVHGRRAACHTRCARQGERRLAREGLIIGETLAGTGETCFVIG